MLLKSPAKINLCLLVLGKREDGYHDILSLVTKVSIFDEIEISEIGKSAESRKGDEITFLSDANWEIPEKNTVSATIEGFRKVFNLRRLSVRVRKNIPPGSGLGGGSSNSASLINALMEIEGYSKEGFLKENSKEIAEKIAEKIGADVPLFLKRSPCIIEGKGDKVSEIEIEDFFGKLRFLIVWPEIISNTALIYSKFDELKSKGQRISETENRERVFSCLQNTLLTRRAKLSDISFIFGFNELENAFLSVYKEAVEVKRELERFGKFHLTGSGSSFYSIYSSHEEAEKTAEKLSRFFKYIFVAEPIR